MTVATPIQPDVTTQSAAVYKAAIDAQTAALAQTANMYAPHEAATPDMTVLVDAGRFLASAVSLVTNAQQTSATITAPVTNPRIDRVVIDAVTGVISVVAGAEAASPSAPAIPSGKLPICQVALATSTTAITNSLITDERAFMANFPALLASANTWTGDQTISTTDPQLILIETDAAADNKRWDLRASGEALSLRVVNDADSATTDIITVQRTGTTVDSVIIAKPAATADPTTPLGLATKQYVAVVAEVSGVTAASLLALENLNATAEVGDILEISGEIRGNRDGADFAYLISVGLSTGTATFYHADTSRQNATSTFYGLSVMGASIIHYAFTYRFTCGVAGTVLDVGVKTATLYGTAAIGQTGFLRARLWRRSL